MLELIEADQSAEVTEYLVSEVRRLAAAGGDFVLIALPRKSPTGSETEYVVCFGRRIRNHTGFYLTGVTILVGGEVNAIIEQAAARAGDPEAKAAGEKPPDESARVRSAGAQSP